MKHPGTQIHHTIEFIQPTHECTHKEPNMLIDWEQHSIVAIAAAVAALTTWG